MFTSDVISLNIILHLLIHILRLLAPDTGVVPIGQGVQESTFIVSEYVPTSHVIHSLPLAANLVPAGHSEKYFYFNL